jgi:hypothetical protein
MTFDKEKPKLKIVFCDSELDIVTKSFILTEEMHEKLIGISK